MIAKSLLLLLLTSAALAQERPNEGDLFGGSSNPAPELQAQPKTSPRSESRNDAEELQSAGDKKDAFASGEVTDNALQLGGIFYQRMSVSAQQGGSFTNAPLSLPLQFDGFMDARPSDRVRGFVDARMFFD